GELADGKRRGGAAHVRSPAPCPKARGDLRERREVCALGEEAVEEVREEIRARKSLDLRVQGVHEGGERARERLALRARDQLAVDPGLVGAALPSDHLVERRQG